MPRGGLGGGRFPTHQASREAKRVEASSPSGLPIPTSTADAKEIGKPKEQDTSILLANRILEWTPIPTDDSRDPGDTRE